MRLMEAREQMKMQIAKGVIPSRLEKIVFTQAQTTEMTWTEEGKEFRFEGRLYDVVDKQLVNGNLIIYGLPDEKENDVVASFLKEETKKNSNSSSTSLIKLITTPFITDKEHQPTAISLNHLPFFGCFTERMLHQSYPVIAPPPRAC